MPSESVDAESDKILTSTIISEMHWRLADIRSSLKYKSTSLTNRQMPKKIKPITEKLPKSSVSSCCFVLSLKINKAFNIYIIIAINCHFNSFVLSKKDQMYYHSMQK